MQHDVSIMHVGKCAIVHVTVWICWRMRKAVQVTNVKQSDVFQYELHAYTCAPKIMRPKTISEVSINAYILTSVFIYTLFMSIG